MCFAGNFGDAVSASHTACVEQGCGVHTCVVDASVAMLPWTRHVAYRACVLDAGPLAHARHLQAIIPGNVCKYL